jgi:hypothetical protein
MRRWLLHSARQAKRPPEFMGSMSAFGRITPSRRPAMIGIKKRAPIAR